MGVGGDLLLASSGYRPKMLLNTLHCTGRPPRQRIIQSEMSTVPRLIHPSDTILLIIHLINKIVPMCAPCQAQCPILLMVMVRSPPPCPGAHIYMMLLFGAHRHIRRTPLPPSISGRTRAYKQGKREDLPSLGEEKRGSPLER